MTTYEAIENRHSVRIYEDKKIPSDVVLDLKNEINKCNMIEDLNIQLITDDDRVFKGMLAHYGGFRNVFNYIALVGKQGDTEKLGYYGEHLVLKAQQLGLNTCWVAVTCKKKQCKAIIYDDQSLVCIIALGYGQTQGVPHKSKDMMQLCNVTGPMPTWFEQGINAVMLAPTAQNKQNFKVILNGTDVLYEIKENKFSSIDLGIIKYHFQIGAGFIDEI